MRRSLLSAVATFLLVALAAAPIVGQEVVVERSVIATGDASKWDHRLVEIDGAFAVTWGERESDDAFMFATYQRVGAKLKRLGNARQVATLIGGSQNLIADTVWTGEGLIMFTARNSNGAYVREISFNRDGSNVRIRDLAGFDYGDSLSRVIAAPAGYVAARQEAATGNVDLIAVDYSGAPLFVRLLGTVPRGKVDILPAAEGAMLLSWKGSTLRAANARLGLPLPKMRSVVKNVEAMLYPGQSGYLMLFLRGGKLFSVGLNVNARRTGKRQLLSRDPIRSDGGSYGWGTADAVSGSSGYGCVWLVEGVKEKVVFRQLDPLGHPVGKKIMLGRSKSLSEPRIIYADGRYVVSWIEGPQKRRIYAAKIEPR